MVTLIVLGSVAVYVAVALFMARKLALAEHKGEEGTENWDGFTIGCWATFWPVLLACLGIQRVVYGAVDQYETKRDELRDRIQEVKAMIRNSEDETERKILSDLHDSLVEQFNNL